MSELCYYKLYRNSLQVKWKDFFNDSNIMINRTVELSRRSVARALPFCKVRDTRYGRL
jgi:hypothetical protein